MRSAKLAAGGLLTAALALSLAVTPALAVEDTEELFSAPDELAVVLVGDGLSYANEAGALQQSPDHRNVAVGGYDTVIATTGTADASWGPLALLLVLAGGGLLIVSAVRPGARRSQVAGRRTL